MVEEHTDNFNLTPEDVNRLKMAPPENGWSLIEAELDRKRASGAAFPRAFLFTYPAIILFLASGIAWFLLTPVKISTITAHEEKNKPFAINATVKSDLSENKITPLQPHPPADKSSDNKASSVTTDSKETGLNSPVKSHSKAHVMEPRKQIVTEKTISGTGSIKENKRTTAGQTQATLTNKINSSTDNGLTEEKPLLFKASAPVRQQAVTNILKDNTGLNKPAATTSTPLATQPEQTVVKDDIPKPAAPQVDSAKAVSQNDSSISRKRLNRLSIAAYYSPNYTRNHLTTSKSAGSENSAEYYDREKGEYAFSAGVRVGYDLNNHWSVSTGAIYSTLAYSITEPVIYAGYDANNQLKYLYPTSCGTIEIPNTIQQAVRKGDSLLLNSPCKQLVRFISVPITARYQVVAGGFTLYAYAGLSVNFMAGARSTLTINNTETTITNHVSGIKNMNGGYLFGAGAQYNLNRYIGIFIEPAYRGSINSLTENISVNCYPYSAGLNAGMSLHF